VVAVDVDALAVPTPPTWKALVRTLWAALDSDDSSLLDDSSNSSNSSRILESMIASLHDNGVGPISARLGLSLVTAVHRLGMTRAVFLSSRHALSIPYRRMSFVELVRMASMLAAANVTEVGLLDALSVGIGRGALDGLRADMLVVLLQSMVGVNWQGTREEKGRVTAAAVRSRVHLDAGAAVGLLHVLTRDAGKAGGRRWRGASEMGAWEDILAASDVVGGLMGRMGMKELGLAAKAYGRLLEHEGDGDGEEGEEGGRRRGRRTTKANGICVGMRGGCWIGLRGRRRRAWTGRIRRTSCG
jgi:hypothetical protein